MPRVKLHPHQLDLLFEILLGFVISKHSLLWSSTLGTLRTSLTSAPMHESANSGQLKQRRVTWCCKYFLSLEGRIVPTSFCSPSQHPLSSLVSYSTQILPVWSKVVTCCYSDKAAIIFTGAIDSDDHWSCLRDNWSLTRLQLTSLVEARLRSPLCPSLLYPVPTFFKRVTKFSGGLNIFQGVSLYFQEVKTLHKHQMWLNYRKRVETSKPLQLFLQGRW